jgi:hypothetical protein
MNTISEIVKFEFCIAGFGLPGFKVSYKKPTVTYFAKINIFSSGLKHCKNVTKDAIDNFISKLNDLKVLNWESEYDNLDVIDGEQWALEITYDGNKKKNICGNNEYPESRPGSASRTPEFNELLKAIKSLLKEAAFFSEKFTD